MLGHRIGRHRVWRLPGILAAALLVLGCSELADLAESSKSSISGSRPNPSQRAVDPVRYVDFPAAPLPSYSAGDAFTYEDEGKKRVLRRVVGVKGDTVDWVTEVNYQFTTYRNPFFPKIRWDGPSSSGRATNRRAPGQLWPLEIGQRAWLNVDYERLDKGTKETKRYSEHWCCKVNRPRAVTVPAGTFDTYKVVCKRYASDWREITRTHIWYYAPAVGHFVKRIKKYKSGKRKTLELIVWNRKRTS